MLIQNSGSVDGANASCYYPLQFYFCRNPGLALPLIALQYHEVKLKVSWGTLPASTTAKVRVDYIYLDTDERRRFAQQSHEYLIEQVKDKLRRKQQECQQLQPSVKELISELTWGMVTKWINLHH